MINEKTIRECSICGLIFDEDYNDGSVHHSNVASQGNLDSDIKRLKSKEITLEIFFRCSLGISSNLDGRAEFPLDAIKRISIPLETMKQTFNCILIQLKSKNEIDIVEYLQDCERNNKIEEVFNLIKQVNIDCLQNEIKKMQSEIDYLEDEKIKL